MDYTARSLDAPRRTYALRTFTGLDHRELASMEAWINHASAQGYTLERIVSTAAASGTEVHAEYLVVMSIPDLDSAPEHGDA